ALNCPTNSELIDSYGFRGLLTPPCANDSGQALGIGLMGFYARGDLRTCRVETRLPFAGEVARTGQARMRWRRRILDESGFDPERFAADLRDHPVAWVDGAAEVGPRALGHRSLLGDPTQLRTKEILNQVKQRQWWRPVAPIVLEEHVADWFDRGRPSPFMLETFQVRQDRRDRIPAALHMDGSARIQTLSRQDDESLYLAVSAFHAETGVPIVCNTSLNDRGEPIANDAAEAVNFCLRKGIKVAYIAGRRLVLDVEQVTEVTAPEPRRLHDMYAKQPERPDAIYGQGTDPQLLFLLYLWPGLHRLAGAPDGDDRIEQVLVQVRRQETAFARRAELFLAYWRRLLEGTIREGAADAA
ncbi:MAG TPA: carbamoyltransferase C-terminal domain-containing protein, partial [Streptosporangiaceae bacterium]